MREFAFEHGHLGAVRAGRLRAHVDDAAAFRSGAWFLATRGNAKAIEYCKAHDIPVVRAQSEGTNSSGGFLVPTELLRAIIALREQTGSFRAAAQIVRMGSDATLVPRRTGGLTTAFTAENGTLAKSQLGFDLVGLTAKKLATLSVVSSELDTDAVIDIGEFLATEAAYAFAVKEDACGFNGDGTSTYGGIRGIGPTLLDGNHSAGKVTAASGHNTYGLLDATDLSNLMAAAPALALPGARWFCSQFAFATTFCRLAAVAGGWVVMPDANGRLMPHYLGFPVQVSQALPQVGTNITGQLMLAFGDLSLAAALGERGEVAMLRSADGVGMFENDAVGYRFVERVDIVVHDLGDNVTAGPIVGLVAP